MFEVELQSLEELCLIMVYSVPRTEQPLRVLAQKVEGQKDPTSVQAESPPPVLLAL